MKSRPLMIFAIGMIVFAGIILTQQVFAEDFFFDSAHDFSGIDFDTGRFSYLPYGEKFYQYKSQPLVAPASESYTRCYFTSDFVLSNSSFSDSGNVIYRFPDGMVWPGGHENSTFYIVRSPSFNFPEDHKFEKLTPAKTDGSIVLEFDIITGLNTFVANSTAFWDPQRSQIIDCIDPFDFEKQEYEYCDSVYPLQVQQNRAKMLGLTDDDFLCKPELISVLKYDGSPACVKPETKEKLEQRGWSYHKETLLVLDDNQQDIGRYLKHVSILDESSIDATVSYPTNTAHHKMFPDEYQSIVSDCTEKNNGANLSLLYLKEIDNVQNKMTFKVEGKEFDGLQCDDALWQEMTHWGYCGPPGPLLSHVETPMPSITDAHKRVGFIFDLPKYLPEGYDIQEITVGRHGDRITMYISPEPISSETGACDFTWYYEGIHLSYVVHPEILSFGSSYSDAPGEPQNWPVMINGNPGKAEQRWVGDRFGMPIPQLSDLQISIPDDNLLVKMSSSLPVEELIKVAESISNPIFNADIVSDYSSYNMQMQNSDDSIPVQITGDTASQICNKIRMGCEDDHAFDATYDLSAHTAAFEQSVGYNRYVLEITPGEICYMINGDPKKYCSTLHVSYSPIVDGNKSTILFKPLDYWKNISQEELYKINEKYGEIFYKELGKMVLKDEIKNELKRQNIENANDDFNLHVAGGDESSQVFYKSVINGTDGKSYMFDGGAYYNQIRGLSFEELIFHDDVYSELPPDLLFDDQPIIIFPKDNDNYNPHNTITVNLEDGNDMIFYNGMSVPIKIILYNSEKAKDQPEIEWTNPILDPAQAMTFSLDGTGLYRWDARLEPEPSNNDWWPRYTGGTIAAYSSETQSLELEKKLKIAQIFVQNAEIPYSGLSTKNGILEIGFNSAIHEMLPDAREYYAARAHQLVPFDVPIMIEEPSWND